MKYDGNGVEVRKGIYIDTGYLSRSGNPMDLDEGALYLAGIPERTIADIRVAYRTGGEDARTEIEGLCERIREGDFSKKDMTALLRSHVKAFNSHVKGKNFRREVEGRKNWARQQRVRKGTKCWA